MESQQNIQSIHFPPVVAVLGHVDHGKTTLLDAIRKTSIAEREAGGITQKIGASSVEILHEGTRRRITFIDTPGHQAFSQMRSRGAQAADISLLIVSAVDGVMPQTKESIQVLKEAKIPFIVVITKADLPTKMTERVKQQLLKDEVLLEGLGGDVPFIEVSAKTNLNIKELLDLILLVFDMHKQESKGEKELLKAIVIESKLDPKSGPRATIVIKKGALSVKEDLHCDGKLFRVRTIINDKGLPVNTATVGEAVEILGMAGVPSVGSIVDSTKTVSLRPIDSTGGPLLKRELMYQIQNTETKLAIILVTDTEGSLEALINSLPEGVQIISKKTGEVSEADILLAKSTKAIVLSFNTKIRPDVQKLAATEKILAKNYTIIYEMIDEVADVMEGKKLAEMEQIYGTAQVRGKFPFEKTFAFGINVIDGRIARGDKARISRGESTVGEATVSSVRVGKNPTSKVEKGNEAGILLSGTLDIQIGDMILCHS